MQEHGGEALRDVRQALLHAWEHSVALAQLFSLELKEYGVHQMRRAIALAMGCAFLLVGYLFLCAVACLLLEMCLDSWLAAAGIVCGINMIIGIVVVARAMAAAPGPFAPATLQEIQYDAQCLKILIKKEKEQS